MILAPQYPLLRDEPLARYTAARLGGPADWLYVARRSSEELIDVVSEAWKHGMPVRVIGGGANVLVSDKGVRGLVVINRVSEVEFGDWHSEDSYPRNASATAGVGLTVFANKCASRGLSGFEWAVSVPGTIGGAVVGNAGAHGGDMAACVREVVIFDHANGAQLYTNADLKYVYRSSALKQREDKRFLVLLAVFSLTRGDPAAIRALMDQHIAYRKSTQPPGASLGSIFKNPPGDYAGRLIEACGLKGHRIGGAQVSPKHANFFLNAANATASDYYALIQYVRETVAAKTGVLLEAEIETLGEW